MTYARNPLFSFYTDLQSSVRTLSNAFKDDGPILSKLDELTDAVRDIPGQHGTPDFGEYREWLIVNTFLLPALDHKGRIWSTGSGGGQKFNMLGWAYHRVDIDHVCDIAKCPPEHLAKALRQYIDDVGFTNWAGEFKEITEIVQSSARSICDRYLKSSEQTEAF